MNRDDLGRRTLAALLLSAVAARLVFLSVAPPQAVSIDFRHWIKVAWLLEQGRNPYVETTYLNWPPVWMEILWGTWKLAAATGLPFHRLLEGFLVAMELLAIVLVVRIGTRQLRIPELAVPVAVGLALDPVPILLTCQHGAFDVLVAIWTLLALLFLFRWRASGRAVDWHLAALALGLGALTKTVPLILAPLLAHRSRRLRRDELALGGALLVGPTAVAMAVLYVLAPADVAAKVFGYRSYGGWYGISGLLQMFGADTLLRVHALLFPVLLLVALLFLARHLRREDDLPPSRLVVVAAFLYVFVTTFGTGFGPQYVYWYLPLLVLLFGSDPPLRRAILGTLAVAVPTWLVSYSVLPSHGKALTQALGNPPGLVALGERLHPPAMTTLLQLPLFVAHLFLAVALFRRLRPAREVR